MHMRAFLAPPALSALSGRGSSFTPTRRRHFTFSVVARPALRRATRSCSILCSGAPSGRRDAAEDVDAAGADGGGEADGVQRRRAGLWVWIAETVLQLAVVGLAVTASVIAKRPLLASITASLSVPQLVAAAFRLSKTREAQKMRIKPASDDDEDHINADATLDTPLSMESQLVKAQEAQVQLITARIRSAVAEEVDSLRFAFEEGEKVSLQREESRNASIASAMASLDKGMRSLRRSMDAKHQADATAPVGVVTELELVRSKLKESEGMCADLEARLRTTEVNLAEARRRGDLARNEADETAQREMLVRADLAALSRRLERFDEMSERLERAQRRNDALEQTVLTGSRDREDLRQSAYDAENRVARIETLVKSLREKLLSLGGRAPSENEDRAMSDAEAEMRFRKRRLRNKVSSSDSILYEDDIFNDGSNRGSAATTWPEGALQGGMNWKSKNLVDDSIPDDGGFGTDLISPNQNRQASDKEEQKELPGSSTDNMFSFSRGEFDKSSLPPSEMRRSLGKAPENISSSETDTSAELKGPSPDLDNLSPSEPSDRSLLKGPSSDQESHSPSKTDDRTELKGASSSDLNSVSPSESDGSAELMGPPSGADTVPDERSATMNGQEEKSSELPRSSSSNETNVSQISSSDIHEEVPRATSLEQTHQGASESALTDTSVISPNEASKTGSGRRIITVSRSPAVDSVPGVKHVGMEDKNVADSLKTSAGDATKSEFGQRENVLHLDEQSSKPDARVRHTQSEGAVIPDDVTRDDTQAGSIASAKEALVHSEVPEDTLGTASEAAAVNVPGQAPGESNSTLESVSSLEDPNEKTQNISNMEGLEFSVASQQKIIEPMKQVLRGEREGTGEEEVQGGQDLAEKQNQSSKSEEESNVHELVKSAKGLVKQARRRGLALAESSDLFITAITKLDEALTLGDEKSMVEAEYGAALVAWAKNDIADSAASARLSKAAALLSSSLESRPNDQTSLFNTGLCLCLLASTTESTMSREHYQRACDLFNRLLVINKDSRIGAFNCGLAYVSLGRLSLTSKEQDSFEGKRYFQTAERMFIRSLELKPDDAKATAYLQECQRQLMHFKKN